MGFSPSWFSNQKIRGKRERVRCGGDRRYGFTQWEQEDSGSVSFASVFRVVWFLSSTAIKSLHRGNLLPWRHWYRHLLKRHAHGFLQKS